MPESDVFFRLLQDIKSFFFFSFYLIIFAIFAILFCLVLVVHKVYTSSFIN